MNAANTNFKNTIGSDLFGLKLKKLNNTIFLNENDQFKFTFFDIIQIIKDNLGSEKISNGKSRCGFVLTQNDKNIIELTSFIHKDTEEWFEIVATINIEENKVFLNLETAEESELFYLDNLKNVYTIKEFFSSEDFNNPNKFEILVSSLLMSEFSDEIIENNSLSDLLKFSILFIRSQYDSSNILNINLRNKLTVNIGNPDKTIVLSIPCDQPIVYAPHMELKW